MKAKTNIEYPTNHSPLARALAGTYEKRSARKTPGEVIKVLKRRIAAIFYSPVPCQQLTKMEQHEVDCLTRATAIVRLWDAGITPADVRAAERNVRAADRKRKGMAK